MGRDTMQVIVSGTKGLAALCVLMVIDRGKPHIDEPVARYWPQFGAEGKEAVLLGQAYVPLPDRASEWVVAVERQILGGDDPDAFVRGEMAVNRLRRSALASPSAV